MGNKKAREMQKRREVLDEIRNAQSIPRTVDQHVGWRGSGSRVLQVVCSPSFEPGWAWEVRRLDDDYKIYRSKIAPESQHDIQLVGYSGLDVPSDKLRSFWSSVCSLAVNVAPLYNELAGADGVSYQLAIFGDMQSSVRFSWWSEYPSEWTPLVDVTNQMIELFKGASEIGEARGVSS